MRESLAEDFHKRNEILTHLNNVALLLEDLDMCLLAMRMPLDCCWKVAEVTSPQARKSVGFTSSRTRVSRFARECMDYFRNIRLTSPPQVSSLFASPVVGSQSSLHQPPGF